MVTPEERMQVLKLIESGQISAEEGAKLLEALGDAPRGESDAPAKATKGRWFRVRVTDLQTGNKKVNITIPLALVDVGVKLGARLVPEVDTFDMDELRQTITSGIVGKVVDIEDEEDRERVEIFIE